MTYPKIIVLDAFWDLFYIGGAKELLRNKKGILWGTPEGRLMGLEPTTFWTTIRRSNLLSYSLREMVGKINANVFFFKIDFQVAD